MLNPKFTLLSSLYVNLMLCMGILIVNKINSKFKISPETWFQRLLWVIGTLNPNIIL